MKTKHTPGPWEHGRMALGASKDRRSGFIVNGPDAQPLPIRICDLRCSPESPFAETQANARLIAAAPEMLAALLEIETRWDRGDFSRETKVWMQMRDAITKALGSE